MTQTAQTWLLAVLTYDLTLIAIFVLLAGAETLLPRAGAAPISIRSRLKAFVFWMAWTPFSIAILMAAASLWSRLGVQPLLRDLAPAHLPRIVSVLIAILAAALIGDFFYYWCHRAQHRFFWRFHAVHHSVREMSGMTAFHHVSEAGFKFVLYTIPLSFFIRDPFELPIIGGLLGLQGHYLHSPVRLNFGPLGRIFQDNRFHRIHHSVHPEHFDKNFGVFTTLWDWMFGTAYFPAKGEWPQTGVSDFPEPESLADFFLAPFRGRSSAAGATPETAPAIAKT